MNYDLFHQNITWSVTEITRYVRELIENNNELQDLWVAGEVSNVSHPSSGHLYFTLKDRVSTLRCVMWRNQVTRLLVLPKAGDSIEIHGNVSVYEAGGQYQFYATQIRSSGEGALYKEFLNLKEQLEKEGLFDESRKQLLPQWPIRIGVITSPSGAALRDILNTIKRRYPLAEVILSPTPVQGETAPTIIKESIIQINQLAKPDVIILARGGGSIEDLGAFNSELVARAIAGSEAPIICGVGHETDFTIADFVSDLRAPTPTAAAEMATPNLSDIKTNLLELKRSLSREINTTISQNYHYLETAYNQLSQQTPKSRIESNIQNIDVISQNLELKINHILKIKRSRQDGLEQTFNALNPDNILKRGFAIISKPTGQIVRSIKQVNCKDRLNVNLHDGSIDVSVQDISKNIYG